LDQPVAPRNGRAFTPYLALRLLDKGCEHTCSLPPGPQSTSAHEGVDHPGSCIQSSKGVPARVGEGSIDQSPPGVPGQPELCQAAAQRTKKLVCTYPLSPGNGGNRGGVDVEIGKELLRGEPSPSHCRIHDLQEAPTLAPDDYEVGEIVGMTDDHERRQGSGLGQQQMVYRQHDLLSLKAELHGDLLHRVNGGPVHIRLAGLAETAIAYGDAKAFKEALERRWAAVHG
jgi:hypothetical protein